MIAQLVEHLYVKQETRGSTPGLGQHFSVIHASSYNVHVYQFLAKSGWYVDQSKPFTQIYLQKNHKLHKFATTNTIFFKSTLSDMYHRKTYMYVNFQQNRVSGSIKNVYTNLFAKKSQAV